MTYRSNSTTSSNSRMGRSTSDSVNGRVGVTGGCLAMADLAEHFASSGYEVVVCAGTDQLRAVHRRMVASLTPARRGRSGPGHAGIGLLARVTYTDDEDDLITCDFVVGAGSAVPLSRQPLLPAS